MKLLPLSMSVVYLAMFVAYVWIVLYRRNGIKNVDIFDWLTCPLLAIMAIVLFLQGIGKI